MCFGHPNVWLFFPHACCHCFHDLTSTVLLGELPWKRTTKQIGSMLWWYNVTWFGVLYYLLENRLMVPAVHLVLWPSPSLSFPLVLLDQSKLFLAEVLVLEADDWHHTWIHRAEGTLYISVWPSSAPPSLISFPPVLVSPLNHLVLNYASYYAAWFDVLGCVYMSSGVFQKYFKWPKRTSKRVVGVKNTHLLLNHLRFKSMTWNM